MGDNIHVSAVVAMAQNRVIGKDNALLWHIPGDLAHVKKTTMGKPLVMGRKTFESILDAIGKPLPGRTSIVVSRSGFSYEGVPVFADVQSAIKAAKDIAKKDGQDEIIIFGGGQIYLEAMPCTTRIYLTTVHKNYDGDTLFPAITEEEWKEVSAQDFPDNDPPYSIQVLERS